MVVEAQRGRRWARSSSEEGGYPPHSGLHFSSPRLTYVLLPVYEPEYPFREEKDSFMGERFSEEVEIHLMWQEFRGSDSLALPGEPLEYTVLYFGWGGRGHFIGIQQLVDMCL